MRFFQDLLFSQNHMSEYNKGEMFFRGVLRNLPELPGERIILRSPGMNDAEDFFSFAKDKENCRFVLWDAHESPAESRNVLRGMIRRNKRGEPPTFAIALKTDGCFIGTIGFQWIDAANCNCEIGYSIANRLWNRGLATEALRTLLPYAFVTLGLNRVQAKHDVQNPASGRVLMHAGFAQEGISRASILLKGRMADMVRYALLKEEWAKSVK